jgi:hypothetical protein
MHSAIGRDSKNMVSVNGESERFKYKFGSVFILSVALHALALAALVLTLGLAATPTDDSLVIPVNIVRLASSTAGPTEPVKADLPQHEGAPPSSPSTEARELSPATKQRHPDELTVKLQKLAELRQPILDQRLSTKGEGLSRISATSRDAEIGFDATFRDFLRDQIEHHWGLDLGTLHGKDFSVLLRVAITKAGVVTKAEVVNNQRSGVDAAFDEAALSARNAALLSSPLTLPPGRYPELMNVILTLNTRDALR